MNNINLQMPIGNAQVLVDEIEYLVEDTRLECEQDEKNGHPNPEKLRTCDILESHANTIQKAIDKARESE